MTIARRILRIGGLFTIALLASAAFAAEPWVRESGRPGDFALADGAALATIHHAAGDGKVVGIAVRDLAADIERVTGRKPSLQSAMPAKGGRVLIVGTLGKNQTIDALAAAGKLDVAALRGAWESFLIATVEQPIPGVAQALVIVGSDARGTAYGAYELSQAIGVSPWHWWADVAPERQTALFVAAGTRRFGPPSVKYRGVFLNDEDWGLQPWAAKTLEPENGGIGPKTYARLFELMLRLKANTVWPAMHPSTQPFNRNPQNAKLADDYAIVMGSSHAEPMLRNNVGEWTAPPATYNYLSNRDGVLAYWDERVAANGRFENIYTLGMRGIHDSNMQGPKTDPERIAALGNIFKDQRAMLAKYVNPRVEQVPQMFCAYKEVLGLYRQGLQVPDDVTIVWPDDNFGYIRNFANADERRRSGGFGVYYHLSYLGAPLSYLWLYTMPPALVWEEMSKAYDNGARTIWIANVGDLKPAEIGTELFLQMAWDVRRWDHTTIPGFLIDWAAREFGQANGAEIASIMQQYYQLNFLRKPEHLQWWLPKETPRPSALNAGETAQRLAAFDDLRQRAERVGRSLPKAKQDAFFELVAYPVHGAALANIRFFEGERGNLAAATAADTELTTLTNYWNTDLAGGKWRHFMAMEPADEQWRSLRLSKWDAAKIVPAAPPSTASASTAIVLEAERHTGKRDRPAASWGTIAGLGRTGEGSVAVFPTTAASVSLDKIAGDAPRLDYAVQFRQAGVLPVRVYLIPTHPLAGKDLRFAIALDDGPPQVVALDVKDGGAEWAQGVLNATRIAATTVTVPAAGAHTVRLYGLDAGVVIDKIVIGEGAPPSYLGPQ